MSHKVYGGAAEYFSAPRDASQAGKVAGGVWEMVIASLGAAALFLLLWRAWATLPRRWRQRVQSPGKSRTPQRSPPGGLVNTLVVLGSGEEGQG